MRFAHHEEYDKRDGTRASFRSSHSGRALVGRTFTRSNVRTFLTLISCLVFVTLLHSLIESAMVPDYDVGETSIDKENGNKASSDLPQAVRSGRTSPPTEAPIVLQNDHFQLNSNYGSESPPSDLRGQGISNDVQTFTSSAPQTNQSNSFVERFCNLRHTSWYMEDQRFPHVVIPGAKYSGTRALSRWLLESAPDYLAAPLHGRTELGFFLDGPFGKYVHPATQATSVWAARQQLKARYPRFDSNVQIKTLDASPGYLFYSDLVPRRILCVAPWIKLIVLLQDPVQRLVDQFHAAKRQHNWKGSMKEWIDMDYRRLNETDVLAANEEDSINLKRQDMAWYSYAHETVGEGGGLGRSLYVCQLSQWFRAMTLAGKRPSDDVLIIRTDEWLKDPVREWKRVAKFLELPSSTLKTAPPRPTYRPQSLPEPFPQHAKLQDFFGPYMQRLEQLLKDYDVNNGRYP